MIPWLRHRLSKERELRMIWAVERVGRRSYLVGTAHFFPYHFRGSLRRYISQVDAVLFEGPLDEESARTVVEYGSGGGRNKLGYAIGRAEVRRPNRWQATSTGFG